MLVPAPPPQHVSPPQQEQVKEEVAAARSEVRNTLARLRSERRTVRQGDSTLIKLRDILRKTNLIDAVANLAAVEQAED